MADRLVILGAGSVGGFIVNNLELFQYDYSEIIFLDDDKSKIGATIWGVKVAGPISEINNLNPKSVDVVLGIAFPKIKSLICKNFYFNEYHFPNFIAKNAWLSQNVKLGKGIIIYPGVSINYNSVIENFVIMNMNCALGHDCFVSEFSSLAPGVNFGGHTRIGKACDIGIGTSTIQGIKIGEYSVTGGMSMVIRDIPPESKVAGVPARILK